MNRLGDYLKEARIRQGLSLKDVYRETGISDSRLSRIENGTTAFEVGPSFTKALANLYKINLVDLLIRRAILRSGRSGLGCYSCGYWRP